MAPDGAAAPSGAAHGAAARRERRGETRPAGAAGIRAADVVEDRTAGLAMLSLQGPLSREIIAESLTEGNLPEPRRNELSVVRIGPTRVLLGRTGYTGEPLCFELFFRCRGRPLSLGSSRRKRRRSLWPRRARHFASGSRTASLRPRVGDRPGRRRDPSALLSPSPVRGQLLAGERRLHRPGGSSSPAGGLPAHPQRRLRRRCRPAPHHSPGGRHRPRRRTGRRPGVEGRPARRLGHERHHGPLLEDDRREAGLPPGRRIRAALHLPGSPRQPAPRG